MNIYICVGPSGPVLLEFVTGTSQLETGYKRKADGQPARGVTSEEVQVVFGRAAERLENVATRRQLGLWEEGEVPPAAWRSTKAAREQELATALQHAASAQEMLVAATGDYEDARAQEAARAVAASQVAAAQAGAAALNSVQEWVRARTLEVELRLQMRGLSSSILTPALAKMHAAKAAHESALHAAASARAAYAAWLRCKPRLPIFVFDNPHVHAAAKTCMSDYFEVWQHPRYSPDLNKVAEHALAVLTSKFQAWLSVDLRAQAARHPHNVRAHAMTEYQEALTRIFYYLPADYLADARSLEQTWSIVARDRRKEVLVGGQPLMHQGQPVLGTQGDWPPKAFR